jgi:diadenosine tetraphosphate (Ap4A) HIT family hydrolase
VFHVHFHIIPHCGERGLGLRWQAGKLDESRARALVSAIRKGLEGAASPAPH